MAGAHGCAQSGGEVGGPGAVGQQALQQGVEVDAVTERGDVAQPHLGEPAIGVGHHQRAAGQRLVEPGVDVPPANGGVVEVVEHHCRPPVQAGQGEEADRSGGVAGQGGRQRPVVPEEGERDRGRPGLQRPVQVAFLAPVVHRPHHPVPVLAGKRRREQLGVDPDAQNRRRPVVDPGDGGTRLLRGDHDARRTWPARGGPARRPSRCAPRRRSAPRSGPGWAGTRGASPPRRRFRRAPRPSRRRAHRRRRPRSPSAAARCRPPRTRPRGPRTSRW